MADAGYDALSKARVGKGLMKPHLPNPMSSSDSSDSSFSSFFSSFASAASPPPAAAASPLAAGARPEWLYFYFGSRKQSLDFVILFNEL